MWACKHHNFTMPEFSWLGIHSPINSWFYQPIGADIISFPQLSTRSMKSNLSHIRDIMNYITEEMKKGNQSEMSLITRLVIIASQTTTQNPILSHWMMPWPDRHLSRNSLEADVSPMMLQLEPTCTDKGRPCLELLALKESFVCVTLTAEKHWLSVHWSQGGIDHHLVCIHTKKKYWDIANFDLKAERLRRMRRTLGIDCLRKFIESF